MRCLWLTVAVLLHGALAADFVETSIEGICANGTRTALRSITLHLKNWNQGGLEAECRKWAKSCKEAAAYTTRGTDSDGDCFIHGENDYPSCEPASTPKFIDNPHGGVGKGKAVGADFPVSRTYRCYLPVTAYSETTTTTTKTIITTTTTTTTIIMCNAYSCPAKYQLKANAASIKGQDTLTCCSAKACSSYTCPSNYQLKSGAASIIGFSWGVCCNAMCSGYSCPSNYQQKSSAASIIGTHWSTCCVLMCSAYTCSSGYQLKPGAAQIIGSSLAICCYQRTPPSTPKNATCIDDPKWKDSLHGDGTDGCNSGLNGGVAKNPSWCKGQASSAQEARRACPVACGSCHADPDPHKGWDVKNKLTLVLLAWFLGCFGCDRCYMGSVGLGVAKGLTLGGCGIWATVDWIVILINGFAKEKTIDLLGFQAIFETDSIDKAFSACLAAAIIAPICWYCLCCCKALAGDDGDFSSIVPFG